MGRSLPICRTCEYAIEPNQKSKKCHDCHKLIHEDCTDDVPYCWTCLNGHNND